MATIWRMLNWKGLAEIYFQISSPKKYWANWNVNKSKIENGPNQFSSFSNQSKSWFLLFFSFRLKPKVAVFPAEKKSVWLTSVEENSDWLVRWSAVILTITRLNKKPAFGVIFLIGGGFSLCLNEHEDVDKDVGGFLLRLH